MHKGKYVFAQLLDFINKDVFLRLANKYDSNRYVKQFTCWNQLAVGTLQPQAVEANTVGTGLPKRFYGMFAYLDLEKMDWRGFKEERFIGTIEN